jgi:hypothetical protein
MNSLQRFRRSFLQLLPSFADKSGAALLISVATLNVGCSCDGLVSEAPSTPPAALSIHCACQIEGSSAGGQVKQQLHADPVLCVPESYRSNPGAYCGSADVREFLSTSTLGALDAQIPGTCSHVAVSVTCVPVSGEELGQAAPSCLGTCQDSLCDTATCTESQLANGGCACTRGSACGEASASPVCAPSLEGQLVSAPDEPLPLGYGMGARDAALFAMAGGWLPGSEVAVAVAFDSCAGGNCTPVSAEATSEVNGTFELIGRPCPFSNCNLGFHSQVKLSDFDLDLDSKHTFTDVSIEVLSTSDAIPASPNGFGFIAPGKLVIQATGFDNGVKKIVASQVNDFPVLFTLDWANQRFAIPSLGLGFPGGEGSITVGLDGSFGPSVGSTLDASLFIVDTIDSDQDGVGDDVDNCPLVPNPAQELIPSPVLVLQPAPASCNLAAIVSPLAEDVCFGGPVTVTSNASGSAQLGTSNITFTATDSRGRTATATQTLQNAAALAGANSVVLNDRVRVASGTVAALGSQPTRIGTDTVLATVWSRGSLEVRDRSRVLRELTSGASIRLGSNVQVPPAALHPNTLPRFGSFPELEVPSFTVGTNNVQLEPAKARSLVPGRYNRIQVASRATLTLAPGDYFMDAFTLEPDSRVILSGRTRLFVRSSLTMRGTFSGGQDLPVLVYGGTNAVTLERNFNGQVRAPRARLVLGSGNQLSFKGGFFAKDVELSPGVTVDCQAIPSLSP